MTAVAAKGAPVCVGLDPLLDRLPESLRAQHAVADPSDEAAASALLDFGRQVIEVVAPHVPVVKINSAFFERYHAAGVRAYHALVADAQAAGLLVIGDIKRADIGHSTTQYALGHLHGPGSAGCGIPDAVTVNPYLGLDGVQPFVESARAHGRGLFVLVQTSNPSARPLQAARLADGRQVCERVAEMVQEWASGPDLVGACGYSCVGAVVSPAADDDATPSLREVMSRSIFLVPGYGAQGRGVEEVRGCFKPDGTGALITASRSVIYAYQEARHGTAAVVDWKRSVEQGCCEFADTVARACRSTAR